MAINQAAEGKTYPPGETYEVALEKVRDFAAAIGEESELHYTRDSARSAGYRDVIAPPTFAVAVTAKSSARAILDPEVNLDFSRVVHGEQKFTHHRPIMVGDVLRSTTTIAKIKVMRGSAMVTIIDDLIDSEDNPVCRASSLLVVRADDEEN